MVFTVPQNPLKLELTTFAPMGCTRNGPHFVPQSERQRYRQRDGEKCLDILYTGEFDRMIYTSLAAKGALAHRLQHRTACKIQNVRWGV